MREFKDKNGNVLPIGKIEVNVVFNHVEKAWKERYSLISEQGGTRSGKTVTTMIWLCSKALTQVIKVGILRKTYPTLRMSIYRDFKDVMQQLGFWRERSMNKTEHVYTFENGSEFHFVAADESEKLKGFRGDVIWFNEATEASYEDFYQLRFRCERLFILDYNPNFSDNHWIAKYINVPEKCDDYTECVDYVLPEKERKENYFFITTYKDNPFLSKTQVEYIENLKDQNYTLYVQYAQGRRCLLQGRVFSKINTIDDMPNIKTVRYYVGIDYGYGKSPTAIVKVGIGRKDLYIQEIAYDATLNTEDIQKILRTDSRVRGLKIVADSANNVMNNDVETVKNSRGDVIDNMRIVRVNKGGRNGRLAKIENVRKMQQYAINITSSSSNVLKEFEEYVYTQDKTGEFTETPVAINDHAIDAVRYVIMEMSGVRTRKGIIIH